VYLEKTPETSDISQSIDTVWSFTYNGVDNLQTMVFPDASADIIFKKSDGEIKVMLCGVMNKARKVNHHAGDKYFGVRFKPGYAWVYFADAIHTTLNQLKSLHDFFEQQQTCIEYLSGDAPDLITFERLVQEQLLRKADYNKLKKLATQSKVLDEVGYGHISSAASSQGLSRRHFSRCFKERYGLSPREFTNIKRLNVLRSLDQSFSHIPLSELALMLGYCDQSHMNHSIKKLTGLTPKVLMSQTYNT